MNGKQKLKNALSRRDESIPVDFGGTTVTGIHCLVVEKLRKYLGLEQRPVLVSEPYQMLGYIEEDLREALGIDVIGVPTLYDLFGLKHDGNVKEWTTPWGQTVLMPKGFAYHNEDGKIYTYPKGNHNYPPSAVMPSTGFFFDAINRQKVINEECLDPNDNLEEYRVFDEEYILFLESEVTKLYESSYGVVGAPGGTSIGDVAMVPGMGLEEPKGIRDVEEWYVSTAIRKDYLQEVFDRQTDIAIENLKKYFQVMGNNIDVVMICGTDFGTQNSTFCSVNILKELYVPYYYKMNSWIHNNTEWKVFKHSCGAIEPFIGELIDCGFDIINPVQWTAAGMNRKELKKKYGSKVTFWGGGVDTQKTLPFGTPNEVYEEVLECIDIFGKNGGFVFNSIHNLQANTPIENVIAMFNAVRKYNGDPQI